MPTAEPPEWKWNKLEGWFEAKIGDVEIDYFPPDEETKTSGMVLVAKGNFAQVSVDVWKTRKARRK